MYMVSCTMESWSLTADVSLVCFCAIQDLSRELEVLDWSLIR